MKTSPADLARMLVNEQKKCDDRMFIGGIDKFINNWNATQKESGDQNLVRLGEALAQTLQGYKAATIDTRREMIGRALTLLQDNAPKTPVVQAQPRIEPTIIEPEIGDEIEIPIDDPLDDFEDAPSTTPMPRATLPPGLGLDADVIRLQGVGPAHAKKFYRLGIRTIFDLLYHFPRRYDDFSQLKTISQLMVDDEVTLILTVCECYTRETRNKFKITNVLLADMTGTIQATFFNKPWIAQDLKSGRRIVVSGRVNGALGRLSFTSPEWEPLSKELLHTGRIVPVYPLTEGLTNHWLRRTVHSVVDFWANRVPDPLPEKIRQQENLIDLGTALHQVHYPDSLEQMQAARRRLAMDEFLMIQLGVLRQRRQWREQPGHAIQVDQKLVNDFLATLPFQLTGAQLRAMNEILGDIGKTQPMSRLLQGDVGSGKTVVAATSMLAAVANGMQAVLLAPTEILAEQHFKTLARVFEKQANAPRMQLLTGSMKNRDKEEARAKIANGEIDIAVGTHALIQQGVEFNNLGLAVIDEQHRFGVEQRAMIRSKGFHPHILVMSATPIPRTLALTLYGDLDLSIIDEMPPGRQEIKTHWLGSNDRERTYAFIRKHVREGEQAFVICPLIEESEKIDTDAAVAEYEHLRKNIFPDLRIGLIHGKLKAADKDATMNQFRDHELDVLVATSVIEVGIDVPNATVMLIEGADRFGLAQLHQFRGRVGRGTKQSFCLLLAEKKQDALNERLKVIESTQNGFMLAEEDLKLRGPGEFFGTRQSGLPDLKIAKLSDVKILERARQVAQQVFDRDPGLQADEHRVLAQRVAEFWKGKGDLS